MRLCLAAVALLYAGGASLGAQTITIRNAGSGTGADILPLALKSPHATVLAGASAYTVPAGTTIDRSLIVVGRDVVVEGTVHGDVIVVNGGLYLHPGAVVDRRAVAIGGGVYNSTLAKVAGGALPIREFTYDANSIADGVALSFRGTEPPPDRSILAGFYGLALPAYDRSDGLSLPVSMSVAIGSKITVDPRVTYRSQLGRLDPWVDVVDSTGRTSAVSIEGGRGTFTNDAWFRGNIINSLEAISIGNDARNYFRGTRGEAKFSWRTDTGETYNGIYAGLRGEHALSVRPGAGALGGPWSFFGRHGEDDMLRVNPPIDNGITKSLITGATFHRPEGDVKSQASLDVELGQSTLDSTAGLPKHSSRNFEQVTFDGLVSFPTFGAQSIEFHGHAVASDGSTPRQRWVYLGGSGTLPTLDLLSLGGDRLVYLDGRYIVPISRFEIPLLGPPTISLRDAIGGAAAGRWPDLHQNVGVRLGFGPVYIGFVVDPATRLGHFDGGFSILR